MPKSGNARNEMLLNEPVSRVIPKLAVPTVISMLITAIYNMADTFFVGRISTAASGAVGVVYPLMTMLQAVAFMIGMGSGSTMSRALGGGRDEEAKRLVSVGFFTTLGLGVLLAALLLPALEPMVRLLGATETIAPLAKDYAFYILLGAPFLMCSFAMNNMLRFQGMAMYAAVGITTGGILNMVLDPLFIFVLGRGVAGAAMATALSQTVSFAILLVMCNKREATISIEIGNFRPSLKMYGDILYSGVSSLGRQGMASLATVVLNNAAGVYGDAAIAAMSIVNRFVMFINSAVIGFYQGFQPVCAFCYGAGRYSRVREAMRFSLKVVTVILVVLVAVAMVLSGQIIGLFRDDPAVIEIGTLALRLQLVTMPLWGMIVIMNMSTQAMGFGASSMVVSCSRQGIFLIPALLILPPIFGLMGIQTAQPVADVLSFILSLGMWLNIMKKLNTMQAGAEKKALSDPA